MNSNELYTSFGEIDETAFSQPVAKSGLPKTRYMKPPRCREIPERMMKYKKAVDLAKADEMKPCKNMRVLSVISGDFIFGDFIEAYIVTHNLHVKKLSISTLSMSQNNIDSLQNLLKGDYVDQLDIIVSAYFYSHERRKNGLMDYLYSQLDIDNKFQLAAASTHCKITLIETHCGMKFAIHGSPNLRSSSNIEQFVFEENEAVYDFLFEIQNNIIEKYKTIKKQVRYGDLWEAVSTEK